MLFDLNEKKYQALARRDAAAHAIELELQRVEDGVKNTVRETATEFNAEKLIKKHPWISAGAALTAGLIASRLLMPAKSSTVSTEQQRIIVEVKTQDGQHTVTQAPKQPSFFSSIMGSLSSVGLWKELFDQVMAGMQAGAAAAQPAPAPQPVVEVQQAAVAE